MAVAVAFDGGGDGPDMVLWCWAVAEETVVVLRGGGGVTGGVGKEDKRW